MYDTEDVGIYELIHEGRGKDYEGEAAQVTRLVRGACPDASALLDVACGTGAHLRYFQRTFDHVEGIDISPEMLAGAAARLPGVRVSEGDMADFDLGRRFDAVVCLFASIGHLPSVAALDSALAAFARHTNPGGVVLIDPWWFPETFLPGRVVSDIITADGDRTVARMSHATVEDGASRMDVHYLLGRPGEEIRHFSQTTRITLFTREEYEAAFTRAGLSVTFMEGGPGGRGLFAGVLGAEPVR